MLVNATLSIDFATVAILEAIYKNVKKVIIQSVIPYLRENLPPFQIPETAE